VPSTARKLDRVGWIGTSSSAVYIVAEAEAIALPSQDENLIVIICPDSAARAKIPANRIAGKRTIAAIARLTFLHNAAPLIAVTPNA
jgi:hypothetical protein